jgi:hypothetical protein
MNTSGDAITAQNPADIGKGSDQASLRAHLNLGQGSLIECVV